VSIVELARLPGELSPHDRALFDRIYHVVVTTGHVVPPPEMDKWLEAQFGTVDAVRRQKVVKVTNKVTLEGSLFNSLRASRPIEAVPGDEELAAELERTSGGPFCQPDDLTPADTFGRVRGRHSLTASNVAKYDGWHGVIVFDEHDPLSFELEHVADYIETAQAWARRVHELDPQACYPFFLWNCLWRSGASILHGHAQMALTKGMHYGRVEAWRRAAARYREMYGREYFADLVTVYRALGLAVDHGRVSILPSLTPVKEKEVYIISPRLDDDLTEALYHVLATFTRDLGVQSFNIGLYQPPLSRVEEDWTGFPCVFRIVDRGSLQAKTSDVGSMEFFAQSVVSSDPFLISRALESHSPSSLLES
jgi:galactose-1-phosphate uridylyltransferase